MSAVKSRREQYSEATRAALLEAAARRFADLGFAGTALEDVAADIQATRGAVYHHFANKTALFRAVYDTLEGGMLARAAAAWNLHSDPVAAAEAALEEFLECCCDPAYGRIVWQEAPIALGWREWKHSEEQYAYGLVENTVKTLIEAGHLPRLPVQTLARMTFHLLGAAGMALAEAPEADKARLKDEYGQVLRHMLRSAAA